MLENWPAFKILKFQRQETKTSDDIDMTLWLLLMTTACAGVRVTIRGERTDRFDLWL